jgi:hypothetical protein
VKTRLRGDTMPQTASTIRLFNFETRILWDVNRIWKDQKKFTEGWFHVLCSITSVTRHIAVAVAVEFHISVAVELAG